MSSTESHPFDPASFSGMARLFPLPNLVLFPHVLQPLHIFEPRYRALFEEAIEGDRLIAMALLAPGWEPDYEARPAVRPTVCLSRVATFQKLDDGCYNLLLAGMMRARIVAELPPTKPFREARVELLGDVYDGQSGALRATLHRELFEAFRRIVAAVPAAGSHLEQLLRAELSLGALSDIAAYTLDLDVPTKQALLEEVRVERRVSRLLAALHAAGENAAPRTPSSFPPDFSAN